MKNQSINPVLHFVALKLTILQICFLFTSNGSNGSREYEQSAPGETSGGGTDAEPRTPATPTDRYEDLQKIIFSQLQGKNEDHTVVIPPHRDLNILRPENPTIGEMEDLEPR